MCAFVNIAYLMFFLSKIVTACDKQWIIDKLLVKIVTQDVRKSLILMIKWQFWKFKASKSKLSRFYRIYGIRNIHLFYLYPVYLGSFLSIPCNYLFSFLFMPIMTSIVFLDGNFS